MNIAEKEVIISQFKFQLPMIICAIWVISSQRKLIWNTLKMWWGWAFSWDWPPERWNYLKIFAVGIVAFVSSILFHSERQKVVEEQQTELEKVMIAEELTTREDLDQQKNKEKEKLNKFIIEKKRKPNPIPFYDMSPFFSFLSIVIIAPIVEECVFRYLIFEIFGKNNPLAYIFSGLSFIFIHWAGGIFNFLAIKYLLLTYLPMTIFFIYAYRKSKWNLTYPMYFHMLWNFIVFMLAISATA